MIKLILLSGVMLSSIAGVLDAKAANVKPEYLNAIFIAIVAEHCTAAEAKDSPQTFKQSHPSLMTLGEAMVTISKEDFNASYDLAVRSYKMFAAKFKNQLVFCLFVSVKDPESFVMIRK